MVEVPMDRFACGCGVASHGGVFYYDPCERVDCPVAPEIKSLQEAAKKPLRLEPRSNFNWPGMKP